MTRWDIYRTPKDSEDVEVAEYVAGFEDRGQAWEHVVTHGNIDDYDYVIIPSASSHVEVKFTREGRTVATWQVANPTILPNDGDRVNLNGQLWIVQHHSRRWHGPNLVEITLSYKATTEYDRIYR